MKLMIMLLIAACLQSSANGFSQTITLSEKKITLQKLSKKINQQTGFQFFYKDEVLKKVGNIDIEVKNASIKQVLDLYFKNFSVTYEIAGNSVVIKEWPSVVKERVQTVSKQIRGTVKDESGVPLEGVTVMIRGGSKGTSTNAKGEFNIVANVGDVLDFSMVGFEKTSMTIGENTILQVTLKVKAVTGSEVVVVGFGTQKKVNLTGAVTTVKMDQVLGDRPVSSAAKALQGAIPGLQITYGTGQPGTGISLNVRGATSINAAGGPLVLLDNVPVNIEDINPADIESVSLLKDAAASSIYGARAAFGVVLITTKKGSKNQTPRFDYATTMSFTRPSDLPQSPTPLEFVKALKDFGTVAYWSGQDVKKWTDYLLDYQNNPGKYPSGIAKDGTIFYPLKPAKLSEDMFSGGFEQLHNFSFSGGNNKTTYRVSLGYADEDGILVSDRDSYKKYNFNSYLTTELSSKITASVSALYKNDKRTAPTNQNEIYYRAMTFPPMVAKGYDTVSTGEYLPYATPENIIRIEDPQRNTNDVLRLFGKIEYKPLPGLRFTGEYTFTKTNSDTTLFTGVNRYNNPLGTGVGSLNSTSSFFKENYQGTYNAINIYGAYNVKLNHHDITLLGGFNNEITKTKFFNVTRLDVLSPLVPSIATSTGTVTANDGYGEYEVLGYFGRINYNYKNRYLLEVNGRYDGSSRFPKVNRFGFFPSFSAGWNLTEESFMKRMREVFDLIKIRGSYGEIGNQNIGNYDYLPGMPTTNASWINPALGTRYITLLRPSLVRQDFSWERIRTSNAGIDVAILQSRLSFSFDLFKRQTLDMLAPGAQLPGTLGAKAPTQNAADLESKGWEFELSWKENKKAFQYAVGFNISDNQGYITRYDNPAGLINQHFVGKRLEDIWGYTTYGYYTVDDFVPGSLNSNLENGVLLPGIPRLKNVLPNPGDIRYVDRNGDSVIFNGNNTLSNPGDLSVIGNSHRRFQFGMNGSASYKNFDLSFFIQGIGKRDRWFDADNNVIFPYRGQFGGIYKHQLDYWTPDNTNAYYARVYKDGAGNTGAASLQTQTKYLSNGAYLRVKNITLGYTLPETLLRKIFLKRARLFVTGENLFTWDHLPKGLDAESTIISGSGGIYPFMKKYGFGLNASF